jgi:flavin-dependent dehydrogenase
MVSFRSNGGRRRLGYGSHPGWHIDRDLFDAVLLERAGSAGAKVAGAALARAEAAAFGIAGQLSSGVAIEARWLIDATGRRRVASRSLGSRYRRLSPALISRTGLLHGSAAGHRGTEFSAHEWGWTWITAAHRRQRTWTAVHAARAEPSERIRHLLAHCLPDTVRTSSATWFVTESNGSAAILPIGDAAGAIDPAGGLGVANALASGLAAGRTIALAAAQPAATARHVARYHEWWAERVDGQASALRSLYEESRIQLV